MVLRFRSIFASMRASVVSLIAVGTLVSVAVAPTVAKIRVGAATAPCAAAAGAGDVERIDPALNTVVKRYPLTLATGVVGAFDAIWAAGEDGVIRIDPATGRVVATIPIEGGAGWTAASDTAVWVTTITGVARIDPASNQVVATIPLGTPALGDPAVVAGKVWVP